MQVSHFDYAILGIASLTTVGLLTPLMRKIALKMNFIDTPNSTHKSHRTPVPYLGGVAIIVGVLLIVFLGVSLKGSTDELHLAISTLLPATFLGLVGLIDDKYLLPPLPRFIAQTLVAIFTAVLVIRGNDLGSPTGISLLDAMVSVLWIVGITNSLNFFDNVDGGASGTAAIIGAGVFVTAAANNQMLLASISIVLSCSSLGFLIWNRSPARIYMGDTGALFLGFLLSILTIRLDPKVDALVMSLLVPIFLLAIPILDTTVAVLSRLRRGVSPFQGGRDHLSHRLMRLGLQKKWTVFILWALSFLFCFLGSMVALGVWDNTYVVLGGLTLWIVLFASFMKVSES